MSLLEVSNISRSFGGVQANQGISFAIEDKEIVGLIGPNGAGKTTLFNCILGFHRPDSGIVRFNGVNVVGLAPHEIAKHGIGRTFQITQVMPDLTVLENVLIGAFCKISQRRDAINLANEVMEFVGIAKYSNRQAKEFPIALQRTIELARALAIKPRLIMLDELIAGLNEKETQDMVSILKVVNAQFGVTLFLIEHAMEFVMRMSQRVIVMDAGEKLVEGSPKDIVKDVRVIKAYLGEKYDSVG